MIDMNRKPKKQDYEPNEVEIIALILTVGVWLWILIGSMM